MKIDKDMVVLITGGASGLGLATAKRLYALGCRLSILDYNQETLDAAKT